MSSDSQPYTVSQKDIDFLRRDKYAGDPDADMSADIDRLAHGEPLAYVINSIPFLHTTIYLDSKPLIPRPETEWWTELLLQRIIERAASKKTISLLDLCAGSGAIGIALLHGLQNAELPAQCVFAEIDTAHLALIQKNCRENNIFPNNFSIVQSNLFASIPLQKFTFIATNPPYIPSDRILDTSVTDFEPAIALFAGKDGLEIIKKIFSNAPEFLEPDGELWMECDSENIHEVQKLAMKAGFVSTLHNDLYGKLRILVSHFIQ